MNDNKTYTISTLKDIYSLPTSEMMEKCLREITSAMIQARAVDDILMGICKDKEPGITRAINFPDSVTFTDDDEPSKVGFMLPDGSRLFTINSK